MKKVLIFALTMLAQPVWAAMSLDKMIIHLESKPNAREDIVVTNPDDETLYLQTEVFRVDNPGQENEKLVPITNPQDFKLLISPRKAVIQPGGKKRFRLMSIEPGLKTEKVYRVTFKPVVGDITTKATGVKILVAFQALVFVQPAGGEHSLSLNKDGGEWKLTNSGNVNVEVNRLKYCPEPEKCEELEIKGRIYPGASKVIDSTMNNGVLELRVYDGKTSEVLSLPVR